MTVTMDATSIGQEEKAVKSAGTAYAGSLASLKEVIGKVSDNRPAGIRKTVRIVQKTVDLVFEKRSILLKLSTLRDFDAITSARIYRSTAISPDEALRRMSEGAGKDFDPILLKAFINMLGVYPIGTLVALNTGEFGLVSEHPEKSDGAHPMVTILNPTDDRGYTRGETVDLSELEMSGGNYKRRIIKGYNPALFGIQPSEYIL